MQNIKPTVNKYWNYSANIKNPNYIFILQVVLTFPHAMMIFCKGIWINNHEYIFAGKSKVSLLLFGCNCPHYHQLISHKIRIEALMPLEIHKLQYLSLVLSRTQMFYLVQIVFIQLVSIFVNIPFLYTVFLMIYFM